MAALAGFLGWSSHHTREDPVAGRRSSSRSSSRSWLVALLPPTESCSFFPQQQVTSVVDEWCPLANFFLDADAARAWGAANSVEGQVLTLDEASARGTADWRDCCESCDCLPPAADGGTVEG